MHRDARNHALPFPSCQVSSGPDLIQINSFCLHHSKRVLYSTVPRCTVFPFLYRKLGASWRRPTTVQAFRSLLRLRRPIMGPQTTAQPYPVCTSIDRFYSIPLHLCVMEKKLHLRFSFPPLLYVRETVLACTCGIIV
jgi:hypothetical protein